MSILFTIAILAAAPVQAAPMSAIGPEPDVQRMSSSEIRSNNAKLSREDPFYIRCQSQDETGSLVKKIRSCRTNHQWRMAFDQGNQNARDTYEAMTSKATNSSN